MSPQTSSENDTGEGISPVVGAILMVAITVLLAAVILFFVTDLANGPQSATAGVTVSQTPTGDITASLISLESAERIIVRCGSEEGELTEVGSSIEIDGSGCSDVLVIGTNGDSEQVLVQSSKDSLPIGPSLTRNGAPSIPSCSNDIIVAQDGSGDHLNIQDAVDEAIATPGCSDIIVRDGTYTEDVNADGLANVTIRGQNMSHVGVGTSSATDRAWGMDGVTDVRFVDYTWGATPADCLVATDADGLILSGTTLDNCQDDAIEISGSSSDIHLHDMYVGPVVDDPIEIYDTTGVTVTDIYTDETFADDALFIDNSQDIYVGQSTFNGTAYDAIHIGNSDNVTIVDTETTNVFSDKGIHLLSVDGAYVSNTSMGETVLSLIDIDDSQNVLFEKNNLRPVIESAVYRIDGSNNVTIANESYTMPAGYTSGSFDPDYVKVTRGSSDVRISNVVVTGIPNSAVLTRENVSNIVIEDSQFIDSENTISILSETSNVLIDNVTIDGTEENGIQVWDSYGGGVPQDITIRDSTIDNVDGAWWWIALYDAVDVTVENTDITSTTNGDTTYIGIYDDASGSIIINNSTLEILDNRDADNSATVDAERNWWGQGTGPNAGQLPGSGTTDTDPYCTVADCSSTS